MARLSQIDFAIDLVAIRCRDARRSYFLPLIWHDGMRTPPKRLARPGQWVEHAQGEQGAIAAELSWIDPPGGSGVPEFYFMSRWDDGAALVVNQSIVNPEKTVAIARPVREPLPRS